MASRSEEKERRRLERIAQAEAMRAEAMAQSEPKCIEINVQRSGGGKVAIMEYGKITSNWSESFSRRYAIPDDWTEEQVAEFERVKQDELRGIVDAIDQIELDERVSQAQWEK